MDPTILPETPETPTAMLAALTEAARELVDLGGPVVAVLLGVSLVALAVIVLKLIQLWSAIRPPRRRLEWALAAWRSGRQGESADRLGRLRGPTARVAAFTARQLLEEGDVPGVRERVEMAAQDELAGLRSFLRVLEVVAQVAPLLGLLGTILGMIEAFKVMEAAGGAVDPSGLAGGIWVALLTTAVGLSVALPALVAATLFEGIVERERQRIEAAATRLLTTWRSPDAGRNVHPIAHPEGRQKDAVVHAR